MKYLLTWMFVVAVLAASGAPADAGGADPVIGSWRLDLTRSRFPDGMAPQSQSRTYAESADGTVLTLSGIAADGKPVSGTSTFKYDGKDYQMTGAPFYDTLALRRVNGTTAKSVMKKAGKVVGTTIRTVSDHGRLLTLSTDIRDARGIKTKAVAVFERQTSMPSGSSPSAVR